MFRLNFITPLPCTVSCCLPDNEDASPECVNDQERAHARPRDPDGTFEEKAADAGVASTERGRGATFVDFNRDGKLDLMIVQRRAPLALYQNILWLDEPSADPILEMSLYLMRRHLTGQLTTPTSLAQSASVPYTTATRRVSWMQAHGRLDLRPRTRTGRTFSAHPSPKLIARMSACLDSIRSAIDDRPSDKPKRSRSPSHHTRDVCHCQQTARAGQRALWSFLDGSSRRTRGASFSPVPCRFWPASVSIATRPGTRCVLLIDSCRQ